MLKEEVKFRWLNASCYEMILPDGKTIITDPFVLPVGYPDFSADDYSVPDYVLCTHTHFDHIMDIPEVLGKNPQARLYVGAQGAEALGERYDLLFGQICILDANESIEYDGLKISAFRGKHSRFRAMERERMVSSMAKAGQAEYGAKDLQRLNLIGSVEYTDFLITTRDNFRIFITGGDPEHSTPYRVSEQYAPNLLIRQASNFASPEAYAAVVAKYHAAFCLPHHQEFAERRLGMPMDVFAERVQAELERLGSVTVFINPEQFCWYGFSGSVNILSKE